MAVCRLSRIIGRCFIGGFFIISRAAYATVAADSCLAIAVARRPKPMKHMKKNCAEFRNWPNKAVTLLGMSGVGKTTLANILPSDSWFHYSGDYRIGTRYLNEPIRDALKCKAMEQTFFRDLLRRDLISIDSKISFGNLGIITHFLGQIGAPKLDGLSVAEFNRRQNLWRAAEISAMRDVAEFRRKAIDIYGYPHFINDAGGSIVELGDAECWQALAEHTLVLYLHADADMEKTLVARAAAKPKPLYYDAEFLQLHLREFLARRNLKSADEISPNEFVQWIFPKLIAHRKPKYQALADRYGHTVDAKQIFQLRDEDDFIEMVCAAASPF